MAAPGGQRLHRGNAYVGGRRAKAGSLSFLACSALFCPGLFCPVLACSALGWPVLPCSGLGLVLGPAGRERFPKVLQQMPTRLWAEPVLAQPDTAQKPGSEQKLASRCGRLSKYFPFSILPGTMISEVAVLSAPNAKFLRECLKTQATRILLRRVLAQDSGLINSTGPFFAGPASA